MDRSMLLTTMLGALGSTEAEISVFSNQIAFDGYDLQNSSIISSSIKYDSGASREINKFNIPKNHGGILVSDYFRERRVYVSGILQAATNTALNALMDEFKRRMIKSEGNLDIILDGVVRRAKATVTNTADIFKNREGYHITYCPFELEFLVLEPFWQDVDYTNITDLDITDLIRYETVENLGTIRANSLIIVVIDSATAITKFNFKNNTNSDEIEITQSFIAGDVIIIDGENKSVTVNAVEVDYDGIFPTFDYGTNNCAITFTGTDILYSTTIKLKKNYI